MSDDAALADLVPDDGPGPVPWYGHAMVYGFTGVGVAGIALGQRHAALNFDDMLIGGVMFGFGTVIALMWAAVFETGWPLLTVGLCVMTLIGAGVTRTPLQFRFLLSEAAFAQWVASQPAGHPDVSTPFRLGLYDINMVEGSSDGYLFYDAASDLSDTGDGIAYLPTGDARAFNTYDQDVFTHLFGPWYAWVGYS
jgi:hypothetical protein